MSQTLIYSALEQRQDVQNAFSRQIDQQAVILEGQRAAAMDSHKTLVTYHITPYKLDNLILETLYLCATQ